MRIIVVGAGPAGMMAAIRASELSREVVLVEKNSRPGRKLLLSGKGRCNITNACGLDSFLKKFSKNGQFLRDAFRRFFNVDLMRFFEDRGLRLKTERQLRVFPASDRSDSILGVLTNELKKNKVRLCYNTSVRDILLEGNMPKGLLLRDGKVLSADKLVLATGGLSFGFTGSTGEGFDIARRSGHQITRLRPGLVPLETRQPYPRLLEGLTLKNIRLTFSNAQRKIVSDIGELLFTRFGVSGPLVLSLSGQVVDWLDENKQVYAQIDLKPALSREQLHSRILRECEAGPKKTIKGILKNILPKRLAGIIIDIANVDADRKTSQLTQAERENLVSLLKGMRLEITRPRPMDEAMITRGGLSLKEINPRTMESRIIKGLYFAGEIIDVDATTGGFNLQAAFSTGYLAGESAAIALN